jgi:hypothetical protein
MYVRWYNFHMRLCPVLRNRLLWIAVLLGAAVLSACLGFGGQSTLPIGEKGPSFGLQIEGETVTLDDLAGRVVVVSFWAST